MCNIGVSPTFSDIVTRVPSKTKDTSKAVGDASMSSANVVAKNHSKRFAAALRQVIDRHALLILRELSLDVRRFQGIQAQTKIGASLLSSRLRRLEKDGIIERRGYSIHPPRFEYFATAKGLDLDELLFSAGNWNIKWGDADEQPSLTLYDKKSGRRLTPLGNGSKGREEKPTFKNWRR
jgi:DNA-binding HxlR family transcriptional regulator